MQELNRESEQAAHDQNKSEITLESLRQSSQRRSLQRSISRGSSRNSSRHSFSLPFGLPTEFSVHDNALEEPEDIRPKEQAPDVPISRLAYLNKPEIPVLTVGTIAACMNGTILPIYGILISRAIKTFFEPPHELRKDSKFWALMFMTLGVASFLIYPVRTYFFSVAGSKLIQRIRSMCFEKVVNMEIGWFDEPAHSSGAIGARLSADAATVRSLVGDQLAMIVQNIATVVAALIIAFTASWQLALIILVLIPLVGINGVVHVKFLKGFSADAKVCLKAN